MVPLAESVPADLAPMEARLVAELPDGADGRWQFEPKWDGFRCLANRQGEHVELHGKSGKPLARYFPEIVAALLELNTQRFVLDGELLIPIGRTLSFDALQMRLHPAQSRITRLAQTTPALYMVFDLLQSGPQVRLREPLVRRRAALERFFESEGVRPRLRLSPYTRDRRAAARWLARAGGGALDGVMAKLSNDPYAPGERAMLKVKCLRTADCVVGGFRYAASGEGVGSLLLGLFNDAGKLDHVGFTAAISAAERPALTRKLEKLRGGAGFTGDAPGGPSRWSNERSSAWEPLKPRLVAEVQYDQVTGRRFRHGTRFVRWRPDKAPKQCTLDQLAGEARPSRLLTEILA
jgi:ATP-dependent DNA ligase